jgi:hypothetical protein
MWFACLLVSTGIVAVGLLMEFPEIWYDTSAFFRRRSLGRQYFTGPIVFRREHSVPAGAKPIAAVGWLLIVAGVVGEGIIEARVADADGTLQTFNNILLVDAQTQAAFATKRAAELQKEAEQERTARIEIEERVAWRRLTKDEIKDIGKNLKSFSGQQAYLEYTPDDLEASTFLKDIESTLIQGKWLIAGIGTPMTVFGAGRIFPASPGSAPPIVPPVPTGVRCVATDNASRNAANLLSQELANSGFDASVSTESPLLIEPGQKGFPLVIVKVEHRPDGPQGAAKLRHKNRTVTHNAVAPCSTGEPFDRTRR